MDPTRRTSWKIWPIGAVTLTALFFASSAAANDHHHGRLGERINDHLDIAAAFAALSGAPYVAAELDRKGDLIEHYVDGNRPRDAYRGHGSDRWRGRAGKHHRHFDDCEHRRISRRSKHSRHSWRRSHDGRQNLRGHKRQQRRQNKKHRRNRRH